MARNYLFARQILWFFVFLHIFKVCYQFLFQSSRLSSYQHKLNKKSIHLFNFNVVFITFCFSVGICINFLFNLLYFSQQNAIIANKNRLKKANLKTLVELPDTASGSELSREHKSTYLVSCFNFGIYCQLQKTKLTIAVAKFSCHSSPH